MEICNGSSPLAKRPRDSRLAHTSERLNQKNGKVDQALDISSVLRSRCSVSVLALAAVAAAGVSTTGYAVAQCNTSTKVCSGTVTSSLTATSSSDVNWTLSANTSLNVSRKAFQVTGTGGTVNLSMQGSSSVSVSHTNTPAITGADFAINLISQRGVTLNQATTVGGISIGCVDTGSCAFWGQLHALSVSAGGAVNLDLHGDVSTTNVGGSTQGRGILAVTTNSAGADISVTSRGNVNVTGIELETPTFGDPGFIFDKIGIEAIANKGNILINASTVSSFHEAIDAYTKNGTITINTSGAITSVGSAAIEAYSKSGNVTVSGEGLIKGVSKAVDAKVVSSIVFVNARGGAETTGTSSTDVAINVSATSLTNQAVRVFAVQGVTSSSGRGIYVHARTNSSPITLSVNGITSENSALYLNTNGGGTVSVTATGTIETKNTGSSNDAIAVRVKHTSNNANINVTTASVTGPKGGILIEGNGSDITLSTTGTVKSTRSDAIAIKASSSGDVQITAENAYSKFTTIVAEGLILGGADVTVTGNIQVSGNAIKRAIYAKTTGFEGNATVTVGSGAHVTASGTSSSNTQSFDGIYVKDEGGQLAKANISGRVTISGHRASAAVRVRTTNFLGQVEANVTTSTAVVTGPIGIVAHGDRSHARVNNAGTIVGSKPNGTAIGVYAIVDGSDITITSSGSITADNGTQGFGIYAKTSGRTNITLNSGATVGTTGGVGTAIWTTGPANVRVHSGAQITANIRLGAGADSLYFTGGSIADNIILDGGAGNDWLEFANNSFTVSTSGITNFEDMEIDDATVSFDGNATLGLNLELDFGTLSLQDGDTGDIVTITNGFTGEGEIKIDANFSAGTADSISVGGDFGDDYSEIVLRVADVTPSNASTRSVGPITVLSVSGSVASPSDYVLFSLHGESMLSGGYVYSLEFDANSKIYQLVGVAATLNCAESPVDTFTCRGAITQREQMIRQSTTALSATLDVSAAVGVTNDIGIVMVNSGDVSLTQAPSGRSLTGSGSATGVISLSSTASGNVSIDVNGVVTLSGAGTAIAGTATTGNVSITTSGSVTAEQSGGTGSRPTGATAIKAVGSGSSITISTGSAVRGGLDGIYASNTGTGSVTVSTTGTVSAVKRAAIFAKGNGGTVTVNTTGAVTAEGRGIKAENAGAGAINITAAGVVTATRNSYPRGYAIEVLHSGSGAITISTAAITGQKRGIHARSNGEGGSINIDVKGDITATGGAGEGIYAATNKGNITISVTGTVSSTFYAARINNNVPYGQARASGTTVSLSISGHISNTSTSTRLVTVDHDSTGSMTVELGSASGTRRAIDLSSSGDITLTMTGNLTSGGDDSGQWAISVYTNQSITISAKDISAAAGIYTWVSSGSKATSITAGTISAAFDTGVFVGTSGSGSITIATAGVTAKDRHAIYAYIEKTGNGAISITDTGTIRNTGSADDTVYAFNSGNGGISITVSAVEGTQDAIVALNSGNGNVSVTAGDTVSAAQSGIFVSNSGVRATEVTAAGTITAGQGAGIFIKNSGSNVTINSKAITAATHGIHVTNSGAGSSTIIVDGAVSVSGANAVYGIYVLEQSGSEGTSITVSGSGSVTGKRTGIWAVVNGAGDATISTEGAVTGDIRGIDVANSGTGDISLTISGDVTATGSDATASAIKTRTVGGDVSITINSGTIQGLKAIDDDESNTTIVVNSGAVISGSVTLSAGVDKITFAEGTFNNAITIDGGEDAGTDVSVDVITFSGGTVTLNTANVRNWENIVVSEGTTISFPSQTTALNIDDLKLSGTLSLQNDVAGTVFNLNGDLSAGGTIILDVNFDGGVTGTAPNTVPNAVADEIVVAGDLTGTHTIVINDVTPSDIFQRVLSLKIFSVSGTIDENAEILVDGGEFVSGSFAYQLVFDSATKSYSLTGSKGTLKCDAVPQAEGSFTCSGVISARERISARNTVDIIVTLESSATVDIAKDRAFDIQGQGGISFTQGPNGGELKATGSADAIILARGTGNGSVQIQLTGTATLSGPGTAVQATSSGTGEISISTAAVIAGNESGTAIKAYGKGRSVTVNATTVSGAQNAIVAKNTGAVGATTVTTTGNVSSKGAGINAYSLGGAVTVNANVVDGDEVAILAENRNRVSVVTVNTSGTITSRSAAIKAYSDGGGVNLNAFNVTGSSGAIIAKNRIGAGAVTVTSTGTLNTTSGTALYATSQEGAVTISVASVSGETGAIFAKSIEGPGTIAVTTTGNVTTRSGAAIYAYSQAGQVAVRTRNVSGETNAIVAKNNSGTVGSISVTTSGAVAASDGAAILAENKGNGSLSVETDGTVTGSGATGDGIHATNDENGTLLTINAGGVTGQRHAIFALNKGSDTLSITTNGTISATASSAIHAASEGEGGISIVIGGSITGGTGGATIDTLTDDQTTNIALNTGATVSAGESGIAIRNDEGASNVSIREGSTLVGAVRLGGGVDRVILQGGNIGTSIIDGGSDGETDTSIDVLTVSAGSFVLAGGTQSAAASQFVNWERITVDASVSASVSGNVLLEVDRLEIDGALTMRDNRPDDSLRVTGIFAGSTILDIDVNFASGQADTLSVSGGVSGTKFLRINDVSPESQTERQAEISLVQVDGNVSNNSFTLTGRSILSGGNQYELIFDPRTKEFKLSGISAGGPMLLSAQITFFDGFARVSSMSERRLNRRSLSTNDSGTGRGAWFRQINSKINHGLPSNNRAPKFDSSVLGYQTGFDMGRFVSPIGTFVYGVTAQYNEVNSDVSVGTANKGLLSAVGYGVGATATWYGDDGAYIDFQGQFNDIDADFETDSIGRLMDGTEATAIVVSAEMGQRYQFTDEVAVTPQAQLSWGQVDVNSFSTNNNQLVRPDAEAGYTLRAGVEAEYGSKQYNGYLLGNLYYDSIDAWELEFVGENYKDTNGAVSVEFGFGGSTEVSEGAILFLQGSYRITTDSGADRKSSTNLSAGFAFSW